MRKFTISLFAGMVFALLLLSNGINADAYGWGYKKSMDNKAPDVGKYKEIISGHQAIYMDETKEKTVYFTFDNGYEKGYTKKVLDVLKKHQVPAAFFVTGHYVETEPELVKRMAKEGHIIGNHSYYHPDFTQMNKNRVKDELLTLEKAVAQITDQKEMQYVRPPRGTFDKQTLKWTDELNYVQVFWSLAFKDWETNKQKGWKYAYEQVMDQVHPGAIILLHTVSKDNAEALDKVITQLKKNGYTFNSLDDLMLKQQLSDDLLLYF